LKRVYLTGHPHARCTFRGTQYEYNFHNMTQTNVTTGKCRQMRPPVGMRQPRAPLLPQGRVVYTSVPRGTAGTVIVMRDPRNPGGKLEVQVPSAAQHRQIMVVCLPPREDERKPWFKPAYVGKRREVPLATAAAGGLAGSSVNGVLLEEFCDSAGDHSSRETLKGGISDVAGDTAGDVTADWFREDAEDFADDFIAELY